MPSPLALTGTPGTGKSSVARQLAPRLRTIEVGRLAERLGAARGRGRSVVVDLDRLRRALRRTGALDEYDLVVGHLAHLLPVAGSIVLRCEPRELLERLRHAHRGSRADRQANFIAEATDAILVEALAARTRVAEVDTSGRSVASVARTVLARWRSRRWPRGRRIDWLSRPGVTEHLLDGPS